MSDIRYIDIHAHVNFVAFDEDRQAVINRASESGVAMINVGTQITTSGEAVTLAESHDHIWAIVGLHPVQTTKAYHDEAETGEGSKSFTSRGEIFDTEAYAKLAQHPKVVAIGECGLDYYRNDKETKRIQEAAFRAQIELALAHDLPIMIHVRSSSRESMDAYEDVLDILTEYRREYGDKLRGDVHFFAGTTDIAERFLQMGFYLSFTGVVTFARQYEKLVKYLPLDRMMAETDCPYVAPAPHRGKRNEPVYVIETYNKIARVLKQDEDVVRQQLVKNAENLFGINLSD